MLTINMADPRWQVESRLGARGRGATLSSTGVILASLMTSFCQTSVLTRLATDTMNTWMQHITRACLRRKGGKGSGSLEMSIRDERHKDQHRSPGISFHASVNNMSDPVKPVCSTYRQFEMLYCGFS
jgi:hypothetical protein